MNIAELKALWKEVFGDSDEYLDIFFSRVYKEKNTLVRCIDGKPAAALYMIPYEICINGKKHILQYLYALATKAEYRRKGIMTELIHQAHKIGKKRGYVSSVLIPACQELYAFYQQLGYNIAYYQNKLVLSKSEIERLCWKHGADRKRFEIKALNIDSFQKMYEKSIWSGKNGIRQSGLMNNFYLEMLQQDGGTAVSILLDNKNTDLYALIGFDNASSRHNRMIVYETNAKNDDESMMLLLTLADNFEFWELEGLGLELEPAGMFGKHIHRIPYALIHPFSDMDIQWNRMDIHRLLI
ncbi:MAG: GNAT family N-acetyltransferase [Lachnospiraceae bacterium]|nr:GNAT family N-acetyltransferase [Lachnospiraceae bacterium]